MTRIPLGPICFLALMVAVCLWVGGVLAALMFVKVIVGCLAFVFLWAAFLSSLEFFTRKRQVIRRLNTPIPANGSQFYVAVADGDISEGDLVKLNAVTRRVSRYTAGTDGMVQ